MAQFDIRQVTRYVLVRKGGSPSGQDADVGEFKRRDEAEAVLAALKGERADCIKVGNVAIPLAGIEALDAAGALDLLESRVQNARRVHMKRADERAEWEAKSAGRAARIRSAYGSNSVQDC